MVLAKMAAYVWLVSLRGMRHMEQDASGAFEDAHTDVQANVRIPRYIAH
jgi:hypothetical protein